MQTTKSPNVPLPNKVPAMTSASMIPPLEDMPVPQIGMPAAELGDDIVAKPLAAPDFAMDIKPFLNNSNLWPRWIFTDRRRYAQATAQGWRNCKMTDLKPGYAKISPYSCEGGTKYINGDLILMVIDRSRYLGALKYKHQVAANLSDAAVQRRISAQKGQSALGETVAAVNAALKAQGKRAAIETFDPSGEVEDMKGVMADSTIAAKELGRIGESGLDMGPVSDLERGK